MGILLQGFFKNDLSIAVGRKIGSDQPSGRGNVTAALVSLRE
jgi:hypothetical protein